MRYSAKELKKILSESTETFSVEDRCSAQDLAVQLIEALQALEEIHRIAEANPDILKGAPKYSGLYRIEGLAQEAINKAKGGAK